VSEQSYKLQVTKLFIWI